MAGDAVQGASRRECANVVDDVGATVQRCLHDFGLRGVDRHRHAEHQCAFEHRQHARQLGLRADRLGTRPARFTADVEDVGTLSQQLLAVRQRRFGAGVLAAVGEGIRRHVDDPHHARLAQVDAMTGRLPEHEAPKRNGAEAP